MKVFKVTPTNKLPKTWWNSAFSIPKKHLRKWKREKKKLWVVSYDISEPKRLRKAASICLNYGARQQHSVYECYLTARRFKEFFLKLCSVLDRDNDSLVAYPIHASHIENIEHFGQATAPKLQRQMVF
jgi:CRISPR-associated protein Cas2